MYPFISHLLSLIFSPLVNTIHFLLYFENDRSSHLTSLLDLLLWQSDALSHGTNSIKNDYEEEIETINEIETRLPPEILLLVSLHTNAQINTDRQISIKPKLALFNRIVGSRIQFLNQIDFYSCLFIGFCHFLNGT